MKVNHFQTYQAVRFAKSIDTFFAPNKFPGIKIEADQIGLRVEWVNADSAKFNVIIPYTNIAYFEPHVPSEEPVVPKAKK